MEINPHVIERAITDAFSWPLEYIKQEFTMAAHEMQRPCVLFRPRIFLDGDMWCALYGEDLQNGIAGFGKTVKEAMFAFDNCWNNRKTKPESEGKDA